MERDSAKNSQREAAVGTRTQSLIALFEQLHGQGVRRAVLCPGGRNAPLVQLLETLAPQWGWSLESFFDERAAAFYALGLTKRDPSPVVICVTSGTAVAELFPALIEAHATANALIALSADRPRSHRGSGSPQSMEQVNLFGAYAPTILDWQEGEAMPTLLARTTPVHINLCFAEPLWQAEAPVLPKAPETPLAKKLPRTITASFPNFKRPLVLLGQLPAQERESVRAFLQWYQAPVLAEASSGLREAQLPNLLHAADRVAARWLKRKLFDGVLRLGAVPSWRLWRDLEHFDAPVISASHLPWPGLPDRTHSQGELAPWLDAWRHAGPRAELRADLHQEDQLVAEKHDRLLEEYPQSEAALVRRLSIHAAPQAHIYLGNSRPVRDWNEHALRSKKFLIEENRGVNGIDGQLSTFYGACRPEVENWALVGDLTALYDLQGPWALRYLREETRTRVVVMNNGGGQIFKRMFPSSLFLNGHELSLEPLAQLWGLSFGRELHTEARHALIELTPQAQETEAFRAAWEKL